MGERDVGDALELVDLLGAALRHRTGFALGLVEAGVVDCERDAIRCRLQEIGLVLPEHARCEAANVQHADSPRLDEQRHAEQRADPLVEQDRVDDVAGPDVGQEHRPALGRDASGEPRPEGNPHPLLHLLLDPLGRPGNEVLALLVEQQDRRGVDLEHLAQPRQERVQEVAETERREHRLGDRLELAEPREDGVVAAGARGEGIPRLALLRHGRRLTRRAAGHRATRWRWRRYCSGPLKIRSMNP